MSDTPPVRVRFAPSPTGFLHVGGMRSALFNWLWARHTGGSFILRIEDTDQARLVPEATAQIEASLNALGLTPDEGPTQGGEYGPYMQSERLAGYHKAADELVAKGTLYPCWCSSERLAELRTQAQKAGTAFKYDRYCLAHPQSLDEPHVLRLLIPDAPQSIGWDDAGRGRLDFQLAELDDFVCIKSDGYPTYQFANVVDDHAMEITHVLRADEWIPSTPKHLLLFAAFGWEPPVYAHLAPILGPDGQKKLSKRDGAVAVSDYLDEGYLPEALLSFLATLGWNDGSTQEIYTRKELIERFTLERVQKSPAQFDRERLTWMNGKLIREMSLEELDERVGDFWPASAKGSEPEYRQAVLGLVQERLKVFSELPQLTEFFFTEPAASAEQLLGASKLNRDTATAALTAAQESLGEDNFSATSLEEHFRGPIFEQLQLPSVGPFFMLLRVALTGQTATPGLFETMATLGKSRVAKRLEHALGTLKG